MTALTMPARPKPDTRLRPVPWRRMAWVTWRQHRAALAGLAVFLGALAVYLWLSGLQMHHYYATACHPASSLNCAINFTGRYGITAVIVSIILQAVPALIGAFVGAPVLARELETGTFRFAWTQGIGRLRWAIGKLVLLAVAVTAAATAIGALAGMLIRRVVPAIAATLAAYAGLALATALYLREHYMTPLLTSKLNLPDSAWIVSQWYTKGGKFAFPARGSQIVGALQHFCPMSNLSPMQCLSQHGYTWWASYHPGSRFWPFQWIEGGWLLALSVLLIAATVWLVRRRAA